MIYFLAWGELLVKIGHTENVAVRVASIRGMSPVPLALVATARGTVEDERWLHLQLADWRRHGEWFAYTERVREVVGHVVTNGPRAVEDLVADRVRLFPRVEPDHGTLTSYNHRRCRCTVCVDFWNDYARKYQNGRRRAKGIKPRRRAL